MSYVFRHSDGRGPVRGHGRRHPQRQGPARVAWATAAMLVSLLPLRPWQAHVECIWQMEDDDGVNSRPYPP